MKCKFCKEEIPDGAKFCPMCGSVVPEEERPVEQQPEMGEPDQAQPGEYSGQQPGQMEGYSYGNQQSNQMGGYSYGNQQSEQMGGYNYGNQQPDQSGGYSYGSQQTDQTGGYSYGSQQTEQTGGYSYGGQQSGQTGDYYGQQPNNGNGYGYQYGASGQNIVQQPINGTLYMVFSVLSLLLCCLPLGIASIIFSSKINSQQKNGDYEGARESAKKAKILLIISLVFGIIVNIAVIGYSLFSIGNDSLDRDISERMNEDQTYSSDAEESGDDGLEGDLDGIADKEIKPAEAVSELGDNWDSYTVKIDDSVLALPCEYKELEALGFAIDEEIGLGSEDGTVSGEGYDVGFMTTKDGDSIVVEFINPDSEDKKVEECLIGGISVYDYSFESGKHTIAFPGNIQMGATKEEVMEKYGETEEVYEGEEYHMYSWYGDDSYYASVEMSFDTSSKKLVEVSVRNYGQ